MREVEFLDLGEAIPIKIVDLLNMVSTRLPHDALGTNIIKKDVMHERRQPGRNPGTTTDIFLTNQDVPAAIKISNIVVRSNPVFLGPIDFKIAKRLAISASNQRKRMGVIVHLLKVSTMFCKITFFLPEMGNTRIIHPAVKMRKILFYLCHPK